MSVLKVHLTYWCTAQCDHCRFACSRQPGPAIDYDLLMACVDTLKKRNNLELVVLMGGEPSLFSDLTHRLTADITTLGIAVRVETNASWATSDQAARRFLEPLYTHHASLMFSLDTWHAPHVPRGRVTRAVLVSEALGGDYVLEVAYLDFPRCEHERDRHTNRLLAGLEQQLGKRPKMYQGTILFNGRAAEKLAHLVAPGRGIPTAICDQVPWWSNGHLKTLELLELDPEGYLSKGCGIAIANIRETPVETILADYDATRHPIFSTLLSAGPLGLAREAEALGYRFKTDYADKCQLCQEAREVLVSRYPTYLVPAQHYTKTPSAD